MKFNSKKVFKFAGEVTGCVVMGIVSAATQTLWYRIAEPKILDAMDKNDAKQKHPIGFRGGSPDGLLSSFRSFCTFLYGEKEFCSISIESKNCGRGQAWSSSARLALGARIVATFSLFLPQILQIVLWRGDS